MAYTDPTIDDFKAWFSRDFPFGNDSLAQVNDTDVTKCLTQQQNTINPCLFPTQNIYTQGALLLAAFNLVQNLRASSQGIAAKFDWTTSSKSVGGVSAGFAIPSRILENPSLAIYASNTYGVMYLQLILPFLVGQMFSVDGNVNEDAQWFGGVYGSIGPWSQE